MVDALIFNGRHDNIQAVKGGDSIEKKSIVRQIIRQPPISFPYSTSNLYLVICSDLIDHFGSSRSGVYSVLFCSIH